MSYFDKLPSPKSEVEYLLDLTYGLTEISKLAFSRDCNKIF